MKTVVLIELQFSELKNNRILKQTNQSGVIVIMTLALKNHTCLHNEMVFRPVYEMVRIKRLQ